MMKLSQVDKPVPFVKNTSFLSPTARALESDPQISNLLQKIQVSPGLYDLNKLPISARNRDLNNRQNKMFRSVYSEIRQEISSQIQEKAQNLFLNTEKSQSASNLFKYNKFTEKDGRYHELCQLKIENNQLKQQIAQLKKQIEEVDEFRLVMGEE